MGEENFPNVSEVGEGGFGLNEACSDDEAGGVVDGEGEDLEFFSGPPLVRGAVVLEEVAVVGKKSPLPGGTGPPMKFQMAS